jgi:predicted amidohydrolase YtcJ
MFEPYVGGGTGFPFWEQDDLNRTVALYDKEGFQVMLHAIGDKAIHMALDSFEYAAKANGTRGRRHRVEHAEVPLLADLPRFKQLEVIASTQAMFASPDATVLENFALLLGRNARRMRTPSRFMTMRERCRRLAAIGKCFRLGRYRRFIAW